MHCSGCKYLQENKKYEGALCGKKYYCEKMKQYVYGCDNCCSGYEKSYSRKDYVCSEIYKDGKNFFDDDRPISLHIFYLILIIILGIIANIMT